MSARSSSIAALSVLALAVAACGGSDESTSSSQTPEPTAAPAADPEPVVAENENAAKVADDDDVESGPEELFPDVIDATAEFDGATWTVSATLSSPYDSPERYADAWRVVGPDGTVYGERILTHDHAGEQPFTRSESGIEIPADVTEVTIEGRDQVSGYGGETFALPLPR